MQSLGPVICVQNVVSEGHISLTQSMRDITVSEKSIALKRAGFTVIISIQTRTSDTVEIAINNGVEDLIAVKSPNGPELEVILDTVIYHAAKELLKPDDQKIH